MRLGSGWGLSVGCWMYWVCVVSVGHWWFSSDEVSELKKRAMYIADPFLAFAGHKQMTKSIANIYLHSANTKYLIYICGLMKVLICLPPIFFSSSPLPSPLISQHTTNAKCNPLSTSYYKPPPTQSFFFFFFNSTTYILPYPSTCGVVK